MLFKCTGIKIAIENYVADNNLNPVKPTILVSCKDTTHANQYLTMLLLMSFMMVSLKKNIARLIQQVKQMNKVEQLLTLEKQQIH